MSDVSSIDRVRTGDVVWYLASSLSQVEAHLYAEASNGVVLRGDGGLRLARRLRRGGWSGRLWLDPATYERPSVEPDRTLFGDRWALVQDELAVTDRISPGTFVASGDRSALSQAVAKESRWLLDAGGGRLSLALDVGWLKSDVDFVVKELADLGEPIALALADANDPLSHSGAVQGLVSIVRGIGDLLILRGDLGALGAVAHGARLGTIGTSTAVRHAVPPGKSGGGVSGDRTPSVFLRSLLGFRLGSFLDQLPRDAVPVCELSCCLGARLSRFNDERMAPEARVHNRLSIQVAIDEVLERPVLERPRRFWTMCQQAIYATETLEASARRRIATSRQLLAWAALS